jgi:hypothetical protein
MKRYVSWTTLLLFNALAFGVLGLYKTTVAGSPGVALPFANTTESRLEMIQELKEIRDLLKEQNALLRSGEVKVVVTELPKAGTAERSAAMSAPSPADAAEPEPAAPEAAEDSK